MAEYKPGEMDIEEQRETFDGFVKWIARTIVICLIVLVFLAAVGT